LRFFPFSLPLLLVACQVSPISIVECRESSDCDPGMICDQTNHCVEDPDASTGGTAGKPATDAAYLATPLSWNDAGVVTASSNPFGIRGQWALFDDCATVNEQIVAGLLVCPADSPTPGCCTSRDPALFSEVPDQGAGISVTGTSEDTPGKVCFKGATARIIADTSGRLAYDWQWGFNGGLPLAEWDAFDATRDFVGGPIVGFRVTLDGPATNVPVNVTVRTPSGVEYGVNVSLPADPVTLLFAEATAADWVVDPPPLDPSQVDELIFSIESDVNGATPFDFCVSDVQVLQARITP
jgi:hypothetical protein